MTTQLAGVGDAECSELFLSIANTSMNDRICAGRLSFTTLGSASTAFTFGMLKGSIRLGEDEL